MDQRELHYLLTTWGMYWREIADRLGSTGPSPLAAFRDGIAGRFPCSRLPAPAYVLEHLPPMVRLVSAAIVIAADQGHVLPMQVIRYEYIAPCRTQRQTAKEAGMGYEDYRRHLASGRYQLRKILADIQPAHRRLGKSDVA